jgi:hypothetical protein
MSERDDSRDDDLDDPEPEDNIRDLRAKARQADELAAKVAAMERTEAFRSAGLDPNDPRAKYFVKGYEGELTPDAIKAAATEAGLAGEADQAAPDLTAHERLAAASEGAGTPAPPAVSDEIRSVHWRDPDREEKVLAAVERAGGYTTRMTQ